jgi:sortase A
MISGPATMRRGQNRSRLASSARWRVLETHTKAEQLLAQVGIRCSRLLLSYVLLTTGAVLCASVTGTYIWMYFQQERLLAQWDEDSLKSGDSFTKISIPKIHLEAVVLEGASRHSLLVGPARLLNSALPGSDGNIVIAGHRDTFFRHVHKLRYGDDIYVMKDGQHFHYRVIARKVVEPTDVSVLRPSTEGHLTLITCFPTNAIGPAPERLVVIARLVRARLLASSTPD